MRTTLTLEDDVAAPLRKAVRKRRRPLRVVVNEALRAGLAALEQKQAAPQTVHRTEGFDVGPAWSEAWITSPMSSRVWKAKTTGDSARRKPAAVRITSARFFQHPG